MKTLNFKNSIVMLKSTVDKSLLVGHEKAVIIKKIVIVSLTIIRIQIIRPNKVNLILYFKKKKKLIVMINIFFKHRIKHRKNKRIQ
jgi:hypothetical protein